MNGFKLFSRRALAHGEDLQLGMVLPDQISGVNTVSFDARVVWAETLDAPGEFQVGFQFQTLNSVTRDVIENLMENY